MCTCDKTHCEAARVRGLRSSCVRVVASFYIQFIFTMWENLIF